MGAVCGVSGVFECACLCGWMSVCMHMVCGCMGECIFMCLYVFCV